MSLPVWPFYDAEQLSAAEGVLASGQVNAWTGNRTKCFEEQFSRFVGCKYSIAVANGSLALSSAYYSLGLVPGDEVITTPRTFVATASSLVLLGLVPVFADVDPSSGAITASSIEPLITSKTRAISVVHLGGWPAPMIEICDLAKSYGLYVVEDCAQAHGALINGQSVGSFGDVSAWSFCQEKIISTAGEGGMVSTSSSKLWDSMWSYKDHGKTLDSVNRSHSTSGFRWLHDRFGSNFRLTELQSAIGSIQLQRLQEWTSIRTRNALLLANSLSRFSSLRIPLPGEDLTHAWYKFYAFVIPEGLAEGWNRDRIISEINSLGFPAFSGSCSEIYLEKCFQDVGFAPAERLPVARALGETSLMFLVHPTITFDQMVKYVESVSLVVQRASR